MKNHKMNKSKLEFPASSKPTHPTAAEWGDGKEAIHSGGKGRNAGLELPPGVMKESGKS